MNPIDQVESDIKNLRIQGATNVALAVLDALEKTIVNTPAITPEALKDLGTRLAYARPTEPLAQNALRYIFTDQLQDARAIKEKVATYKSFVTDAKKAITGHGSALMHDGATYLTHCHASTVTNVFLNAHREGKHIRVIATETRPLMQGRITIKELLDGGIEDVTMIIDSAAASILSDPARTISAVLIGADLLSEHGFVNKIGSLSIVIAAHARNIPVYCFSTLLKYDPGLFTPALIETRDPKEIWPDAPQNLTMYAPAFDYTPYSPDVTVVCEAGTIKGDIVKHTALNQYPFLNQTNTAPVPQ